METPVIPQNSFVFRYIKFIFGMRLPWDVKHQPNNLLLWFGLYHVVSAQLLSWSTFCGHPKVLPLKVGRFPILI